MLVPNMTLPEIKHAVMHDYENGLRIKLNNLRLIKKRTWRLNNQCNKVETISWKNKSNNNWRIIASCTKNNVHLMPYVSAYNDYGIMAAHLTHALTPIAFMHFNTHFFKRFKERMKLNIKKPQQLVKYFFKQNLYMMPCTDTRKDGTEQVFTPLKGGIGLGNYHEDTDIFEFKTFVDNSLLTKSQQQRIHDITVETIENIRQALLESLRKPR